VVRLLRAAAEIARVVAGAAEEDRDGRSTTSWVSSSDSESASGSDSDMPLPVALSQSGVADQHPGAHGALHVDGPGNVWPCLARWQNLVLRRIADHPRLPPRFVIFGW